VGWQLRKDSGKPSLAGCGLCWVECDIQDWKKFVPVSGYCTMSAGKKAYYSK
jgi:hypothetical protein